MWAQQIARENREPMTIPSWIPRLRRSSQDIHPKNPTKNPSEYPSCIHFIWPIYPWQIGRAHNVNIHIILSGISQQFQWFHTSFHSFSFYKPQHKHAYVRHFFHDMFMTFPWHFHWSYPYYRPPAWSHLTGGRKGSVTYGRHLQLAMTTYGSAQKNNQFKINRSSKFCIFWTPLDLTRSCFR